MTLHKICFVLFVVNTILAIGEILSWNKYDPFDQQSYMTWKITLITITFIRCVMAIYCVILCISSDITYGIFTKVLLFIYYIIGIILICSFLSLSRKSGANLYDMYHDLYSWTVIETILVIMCLCIHGMVIVFKKYQCVSDDSKLLLNRRMYDAYIADGSYRFGDTPILNGNYQDHN